MTQNVSQKEMDTVWPKSIMCFLHVSVLCLILLSIPLSQFCSSHSLDEVYIKEFGKWLSLHTYVADTLWCMALMCILQCLCKRTRESYVAFEHFKFQNFSTVCVYLKHYGMCDSTVVGHKYQRIRTTRQARSARQLCVRMSEIFYMPLKCSVYSHLIYSKAAFSLPPK